MARMLQGTSTPPVQNPAPGIARAGERAQPRLREQVRALLGQGKVGMIVDMGQQAVNELAKMLRDPDEELFRRSDAAMALGEILIKHERLDAREGLVALRWAARHEDNHGLREDAMAAFRNITGLYPSQCNGHCYKNDRD
ncbi:MAG: hypothetical protein PHQ80_02670 [Candidatus ainarchaeum sp.]|nr:hypothetical protein [Candidatus ainarchaeum sp.]